MGWLVAYVMRGLGRTVRLLYTLLILIYHANQQDVFPTHGTLCSCQNARNDLAAPAARPRDGYGFFLQQKRKPWYADTTAFSLVNPTYVTLTM